MTTNSDIFQEQYGQYFDFVPFVATLKTGIQFGFMHLSELNDDELEMEECDV